jgi:cobalt-zinc-cadmium efflux system protein
MPKDHSGHQHNHGPGQELTTVNTAFIVGIALNALFVILEFLVGYYQSSLSLISDAGHNATDVFSLLISLFAFRMMKAKATDRYTYGYKKASILASLMNAVLLVLTVIFIFYEGIQHLRQPLALKGAVISVVALIGVVVNGISAYLFFKDKAKDINIKGAYLHLLSDAIVSFGVVAGGIIIYYTQWYWVDTMLSFIIGLVILKATWGLLSESIRLALDAVPKDIDLAKVKATILSFPEIASVHHIHIWPLSSSENALTAHLVLKDSDLSKFEATKQKLKHALAHLHIGHVTLETESGNCGENFCSEEQEGS